MGTGRRVPSEEGVEHADETDSNTIAIRKPSLRLSREFVIKYTRVGNGGMQMTYIAFRFAAC